MATSLSSEQENQLKANSFVGSSGLRALRGTKCPLLRMFFFFFLISSAWVTFLPEGCVKGFRNVAWGFNSQKNKISLWKNNDRSDIPLSIDTTYLFRIL
jgi:hypothetical protein